MEFGYFTLSDNHYPDNPRSANQLVVNSRPDLLLANIASQTKTSGSRPR